MDKDDPNQRWQRMSPIEWLMLVGLAFSWGGSFALNEVLLAELTPFSIVWARQVVASLLFLPFALPYLRQVDWSINLLWRLVVMSSAAIAIPFSLFALGQQHITSVLAGIGNGAVPLFTMLIGGLWMVDERIGRAGVLGMIVGFSGILLLFMPLIEARDFASIWGFAATVLASSMYGFANVFVRTIPKIPLLVQALMMNFIASLVLTPAMLWEQPDFTSLSYIAWGSIATHGLLGSFCAYILYLKLIRRVGSVNTSQVAYLIPFTALFLGLFVLGEEVSIHVFLALGLVVGGMWIKDRSQKNVPRQSPARDA